MGDFGEGDAYLERLLEIMRLTPPKFILEYVASAYTIGVVASITGEAKSFDVAEAAAETALSSPFINPFYVQLVRTGLALIGLQRGDVEAASEHYAALNPLQITLSPLNMLCGHRVLGLLAQTIGRLDHAMAHFEDSLTFCRQAGARPEIAWTCHDYAETLLQRDGPGDLAHAHSLVEEGLSIAEELGMPPLAERLGTLQQQAASMPGKAPVYPDGLTEREIEVLRLLAKGRSNREIAEDLVISVNTVFRHVSNIFSKTGSSNRAEAATYANQNNLLESGD